jgi:hypothetical protein
MKALKLKSAAFTMTFLVSFCLIDYGFSSPAPVKRLNLYDAQDNYLMYVDFEYDKAGKDTAYSVYFGDGTFTRRVVVGRNATTGFKEKETALNCIEDTVFNSTFTPNGTKTDLMVRDQFKMNQLGGAASYSKTSALEYTFLNGSYTHKIAYEYDATGWMTKVNISTGDGKLAYYGTFEAGSGVLMPRDRHSTSFSSVSLRGNEALIWKFKLDQASKVKCEALSLTVRRVAVLYSGNLQPGRHSKTVRTGSSPNLTNGVYIAVMSVDDLPVANTKFIVQSVRGGVR